jgi:hypothetical protein
VIIIKYLTWLSFNCNHSSEVRTSKELGSYRSCQVNKVTSPMVMAGLVWLCHDHRTRDLAYLFLDYPHRAKRMYRVEDSQLAGRATTSSSARHARDFSFSDSHPKQTQSTLNKVADAFVCTFAPFARLCSLVVWLRNTGCSSTQYLYLLCGLVALLWETQCFTRS